MTRRFLYFFLGILVSVLSTLAVAAPVPGVEICNPPKETELNLSRDFVTTTKDSVLLVTHFSKEFHKNAITTAALKRTIEAVEAEDGNVFYLQQGKYKNYLYPHCHPDVFYRSHSGNLKMVLNAKNIYLTGGYFHECLSDTWVGVVSAIKNMPVKRDVNIIFATDAIFERLHSLVSHSMMSSDYANRIIVNPKVGMSPNLKELGEVLPADYYFEILNSYFKRRSLPKEYSLVSHWAGRTEVIQRGTTSAVISAYFH